MSKTTNDIIDQRNEALEDAQEEIEGLTNRLNSIDVMLDEYLKQVNYLIKEKSKIIERLLKLRELL